MSCFGIHLLRGQGETVTVKFVDVTYKTYVDITVTSC
jgi:hypothetical protein